MNNFTFGNASAPVLRDDLRRRSGGRFDAEGFDGTSVGADAHDQLAPDRPRGAGIPASRCGWRTTIRPARAGQAGAGRRRRRAPVRFLEPMTASIPLQRPRARRSACRGSPGQPGANRSSAPTAASSRAQPHRSVAMNPGDQFVIETPGGSLVAKALRPRGGRHARRPADDRRADHGLRAMSDAGGGRARHRAPATLVCHHRPRWRTGDLRLERNALAPVAVAGAGQPGLLRPRHADVITRLPGLVTCWALAVLALGSVAMPRLRIAPGAVDIPHAELACRVAAALLVGCLGDPSAGVAPAMSGLLLARAHHRQRCCSASRCHAYGAPPRSALALRGFVRGLSGFGAFFVTLYLGLVAWPAGGPMRRWIAALVVARRAVCAAAAPPGAG